MTYKHIKQIFESNKHSIAEDQFSAMEKYVMLLLDKNKKVNLISRKDEEKIWEQHILHSLALVLDSRFRGNGNWSGKNILDIGTGGGLPGIPIKIMFSEVKIVLLDSIQKKIHCVSKIIDELGLNNTHVICGRAEEIGKEKEYSRTFDIVVTRAVAQLSDLIQWSKLFLKRGGKLFAMKGGNLEKELLECRMKFNYTIEEYYIDLKGLEYLKEAEKKIIVVEM